jgi:guanylate kinase
MFKKESGDWKRYRRLPNVVEVDFHYSNHKREFVPYRQAMENVYADTLEALEKAHEEGKQFVLFTHGWSTSRLGKTTARSVVRTVMRSPQTTRYIIRRECIQHDSVFVAAIRPKPR